MSERVLEFVFLPDGRMQYISSDEAAKLAEVLGEITTRRASYVEPGPGGVWFADLSPMGGPTFGPFPASQKEAALKAEYEWLRENWLLGPLD